MRVVRLLLVVAAMVLVTASGTFAKGKDVGQIRMGSSQSAEKSLLRCEIYCDGIEEPVTDVTYPGTESGCKADCEEICDSECEIVR